MTATSRDQFVDALGELIEGFSENKAITYFEMLGVMLTQAVAMSLSYIESGEEEDEEDDGEGWKDVEVAEG